MTLILAPIRTGMALAGAILGAGLLLVPPVAAGLAGPAAPLAWLVHLAIGATSCLALGLATVGREPAAMPEVVRSVLGSRPGRAVTWLYAAGFTVGQAMIALVAGGFVAMALDLPGSAPAVVAALVVLLVGTVGSGWWVVRPWARRVRLAATVAVAAFGCLRPELLTAAGLVPRPDADRLWLTVWVLFFAGVGWERISRLAPALGGGGRVLAAVAVGAVVVATAYLALALLLGDPAARAGPVDPPVRVAGLAAAVTLTGYVVGNVATAADMVRSVTGSTSPAVNRHVGLSAALVVLVTAALGLPVVVLFAGPAVAAWSGYLLAMVAVVVAGSWPARCAGVVAAAGLLTLVPPALRELLGR